MSDLHEYKFKITRETREIQNKHKSFVVWFTGLSGSGKSTLANAVERALHSSGAQTMILDGDTVRKGLCNDLGFSASDRSENIRRVSEIANLFVNAGVITLTAFISPFEEDRKLAKSVLGNDMIEVFLDCPLAVCEKNDPKGLYAKARSGEIKNFTGIDSPYEPPAGADLVIDTSKHSIEECTSMILDYLTKRGTFRVDTPGPDYNI